MLNGSTAGSTPLASNQPGSRREADYDGDASRGFAADLRSPFGTQKGNREAGPLPEPVLPKPTDPKR